jgi:hypothetical protein
MTKAVVRQLAVWVSRLSIFLLPPALRHWGVAMQYEVEAINKLVAWALRCVRPSSFTSGAYSRTQTPLTVRRH